MMKKHLSILTGLLLALSLSVTALSGILWVLGTSDGIMLPMMRRFAPSEATGIPDMEYPFIVRNITGYMSGKQSYFSSQYAIYDVRYPYSDREMAHMDDCRALFQLDKTVLIVAGVLSAALLAAVIWRKDKRGWKGASIGFGAVMALVALIAVAAMIDFDRLFILFHKLSFSNDLWQLNPQTDIIIRLMPTDFFIGYAEILGASWLLLMALMLILSVILTKRGKKA